VNVSNVKAAVATSHTDKQDVSIETKVGQMSPSTD